jgi:hypothetical protein
VDDLFIATVVFLELLVVIYQTVCYSSAIIMQFTSTLYVLNPYKGFQFWLIMLFSALCCRNSLCLEYALINSSTHNRPINDIFNRWVWIYIASVFVCECVCLSVCLSVCLLSFCLFDCLSVCLSDCLSVYLSVSLNFQLSVFFLSVCPSVLSVCSSIRSSVRLSVCLSFLLCFYLV